MTEQNPNTEQTQSEPQVPSIGRQLNLARINKNLTIEQVADRLNLRVHLIEQFEQDKIATGNLTYTRGYLKNYAKLLDLDADKLLQQFSPQATSSNVAPQMQSFSRKQSKKNQQKVFVYISFVLFIVIVSSSIVFWLQQPKSSQIDDMAKPTQEELSTIIEVPQSEASVDSETLTAAEPQAESNLEVTEPSVAMQAAEPTTKQQANVDVNEAQNAPQATNITASASVDIETPAPVEKLTAPVGELAINFADDCWIQVTDANGDVIIDGLKLSGKRIALAAILPLKFKVGAPSNITVSVDGNDIDLTGFKEGRVARFTYPKPE